MPHTNRQRKKNLEWNKKKIVTTDDGWSTVTSTNGKPFDRVFQDHHPNSKETAKFTDSNVKMEVINKEYLEMKELWKRTSSAPEMHRVFSGKKHLKIDRAICFGLGRLGDIQTLRSQRLLQLVAFADMIASRKLMLA